MRLISTFCSLVLLLCANSAGVCRAEVNHQTEVGENFERDRLVAWCIVPFDASNRSPERRAKMLVDLGLKRVAYDWRAEHVPEFEEEIQQYRRHGLEFFAFWNWHDSLGPLIKQYDVHPQIWMTNPSPPEESQHGKVKATAQALLPHVQRAQNLECKLGLYNHGGWGGEPENLVAVCKFLREHHNAEHVGIVYNFHHAHDHINNFAASLEIMKPYLFCLNLNGMAAASSVQGLENKIIPIGNGVHESEMIRAVIESGYDGPIGILDHRHELDAKESLQQNLNGLSKVLKKIETGEEPLSSKHGH